MSSLLGLKAPVPEKVVQVSDSEGFAVRGLSPFQVFSLYKRHTGQLSELFDNIMANVREKGSAQNSDIESVVLALLAEAPVLISEMIVLGSGGSTADIDDFEAALEIAAKLTLAVQIDALTKIADLTFTSEMPVGKFAALVLALAQKGMGAAKAISLAASPTGSGESDAA